MVLWAWRVVLFGWLLMGSAITNFLIALFGWLFILGCSVGSFLNVCIYRLPRSKNLMWPSSRCGTCFTPIRRLDNIPLLAYWRLRGRCRTCGATFTVRYFLVELIVGVVFAGLYCLEIGWNIHGLVAWPADGFWHLSGGELPVGSWAFFVAHTTLASLMVIGLGCLLDREEVPRGVVVSGAVCGLAWAILYPWPEPSHDALLSLLSRDSWATKEISPQLGFMPWPVWGPLPVSLPPGSLGLGLLTGLAGILLPAGLVRLADIAGRGIGPSAPALLILTGGFLGWQPLTLALSLASIQTFLCLQSPLRVRRWLTARMFALILGGNLIVVWLGWAWLGPLVRRCLFDPALLGIWLAMLAVGLAVLSRVLRRPPDLANTTNRVMG
jgi:leader peptidase (prepilin peptidase) / N-methyltransferase